ncbi:MAG TPA: hypothetical protein VE978_26160 [Chitinophagales bacterium]|nr:hypothetical protein [Chitinophagales bacterium]
MFVIVIGFGALQFVQAQSPKDLFRQVIAVYQGNFTVTLQAKYRYYPDFDSKNVTDSMSSLLVMHGSDYYFKLGDVEMLREDGYYITTDQTERQISVYRYNQADSIGKSLGLLNTLLGDSGTKIVSFDAGKGFKGIRIYYSGSQVVQADFIIDQNLYIRKCTLRYQKDIDWAHKKVFYSKLEITYSSTSFSHSAFPKRDYGINRFIQIKGNTLRTTSLYSSYQLTGNTQ